jgi:hypothetical protein
VGVGGVGLWGYVGVGVGGVREVVVVDVGEEQLGREQ